MTTENLSLEQQLTARRDQTPAAAREILNRQSDRILAEGLNERAVQVGQTAPDFSLPGVSGETVHLADLLTKGPVVLTFYRGGWCTYCNMQLRAYQSELPRLQELGATLVAVSPQTPDGSLSTAEKQELTFEVLSDLDSKVSRQYGLVFQVGAEMRERMAGLGVDLAQYNGTDSWELPVPATFVIGRDGLVWLAFVDPDYTRRLDPSKIIEVLENLSS